MSALSAGGGLAPGMVLGGRYRIDGYLGGGGMGVILSGTHLDLEAPVAIKVVRTEFAQSEEAVARMLFEARAVARMHGAHIVRVLDVALLESGAPYIVMEQLQGADLATLLVSNGAFAVADAVSFLLQACEGLAEAHGLGIIHRDLKPENLFLSETPAGVTLKILDFGVSKNMGQTPELGPRCALTDAGFAVGSPYYMAPEQMRASPDLDGRADIWSLGAILFELLSGRCPFEAETLAVVYSKVLVDDPPSLRDSCPSAPTELDAIVRRCLQKDPAARFQDVEELAQALRELLGNAALSSDSQRLASGTNLKTEPPPNAVDEPAVSTAGGSSSPTLHSARHSSHAPSVVHVDERPLPERRKRPALLASASAFLMFIALGAWRMGAPTRLHELASARGAEAAGQSQSTMSARTEPERSPEPTPRAAVVVAPLATPSESSSPPAPRGPTLVTRRALSPPLRRNEQTRTVIIPVATKIAAKSSAASTSEAPSPSASGASGSAVSPAAAQPPVTGNAWDVDQLGGRY